MTLLIGQAQGLAILVDETLHQFLTLLPDLHFFKTIPSNFY